MFTTVLVIFTLIWSLWVLQAWLSVWLQRKFAGRFIHVRSQVTQTRPRPAAVVIVPFKGIDLDLPKAIESLCSLNYPSYQLLLIVDSTTDPVYPLLKAQLARHPDVPWEILVAGAAGPYEGQKIHNQLFAIDHLLAQREALGPEASPRAWVFADSDAIPGPDWLVDLVRPLNNPEVGMTTGYRWLEPPGADEPRQSARRFWSSMASVINSSAIGFLGKPRYNQAWGGSMALWAETAIQGDLRGYLEGALCDDYQFGRMVKKMGRRIHFVRTCLVATPVALDWRGLVNFAHRQYLLTRVYSPTLFKLALGVVGFYVLANLSAWVGLVVLLALHASHGALWAIPLAALVLVALGNQLRSSLRRLTISRALGEQAVMTLRLPLILDRWCTWFWMAVHLVLILRACFGRTMLWRGIYYRLWAPQRVERMNRS